MENSGSFFAVSFRIAKRKATNSGFSYS